MQRIAWKYDKGFISNPSNCECERDKSCVVGEYLNYKNHKCRKKLVDKLVEECRENINEKELYRNKRTYNLNLNDYENICSSNILYIILCVIFFMVSISITSVFIYFHCYLKRKYIEATIYWMQFCWTSKWEILSKLILRIVHFTFLMIWLILKKLIQA